MPVRLKRPLSLAKVANRSTSSLGRVTPWPEEELYARDTRMRVVDEILRVD